MANWLERAKCEFAHGDDRATAKADERNPTAVSAVSESGGTVNPLFSIGSNGSAPTTGFKKTETIVPLAEGEERALRAWLANIEEPDEAVIAQVLNQCQVDAEARCYFLRLAEDTARPDAFDDERRRCDQCAELTERGLCLAARRGDIVAIRVYEPVRDIRRRCEGYSPGADDPDRRHGRVRWPDLIQEGDE